MYILCNRMYNEFVLFLFGYCSCCYWHFWIVRPVNAIKNVADGIITIFLLLFVVFLKNKMFISLSQLWKILKHRIVETQNAYRDAGKLKKYAYPQKFRWVNTTYYSWHTVLKSFIKKMFPSVWVNFYYVFKPHKPQWESSV